MTAATEDDLPWRGGSVAVVPKRPILLNIEQEQSLLGALLIQNQCFAHCEGLKVEHFSEPLHQRIYAAIQALLESHKPANPITVNPMLPQQQEVAGLTTAQYLARLCSEATGTLNVASYVRDTIMLFRARAYDAAGAAMLSDMAHGATAEAAVAEYLVDVDAIRVSDGLMRQTIVTVERSAEAFVERTMAIKSGTLEDSIKTGLHDLDAVTGGLHAGELVIGAGRTGMGKSVLVNSVARQVAKAGNGVALFSLEMPQNQNMARMLADEMFEDPEFGEDGVRKTKIEYERVIRAAQLSSPELIRLRNASKRLMGVPMLIDYSSRLSMGEIAVRAHGMQTTMEREFRAELKLIVIDYIKFVRASDHYKGQRVYEIGEISSACKQLAKDTGTTVLLLAQLSRAVEATEDKRPQLQHLRESGDLENDADTVLLLFRQAYYLRADPNFNVSGSAASTEFFSCSNTMEINVAKQRMGRTSWVKLFCDMGCSAVRSTSHGTADSGQPEMQFDGFANR